MRAALVIAAVLLASGAARADDASDRAEARREFNAGQAADRAHDWQAAIDHYLRANDLVPHPNTMFNLAADYERLGKLREAGAWYRRYVAAAPDSPDRDRVIRRERDLARRPATVTVRSSPSGVVLRVDGQQVGVTPWEDELPGGPHDLEIERDGVRAGRRIRLAYGEPITVNLALRAPTGTLRVIGAPPGATVIVDGEAAGPLPLTVDVPAGEHAIRVEQPDFTAFETRATIAPDRETVVKAELVRALGTFGDSKPRVIKVGYLLGAVGGVDARDPTGFAAVELGLRSTRYDASVRIGSYAGLRLIDILVRWALSSRRIAPVLAGGYALLYDSEASDGAGGYLLTGGLRYDVTRAEHAVVSLMAEAGIRYGAVSATSDDTAEVPGLIVPVMLSLQVTYR